MKDRFRVKMRIISGKITKIKGNFKSLIKDNLVDSMEKLEMFKQDKMKQMEESWLIIVNQIINRDMDKKECSKMGHCLGDKIRIKMVTKMIFS